MGKRTRFFQSLNASYNPNTILLYWAGGQVTNNWGDALNPVLVNHLSRRTPIHCNTISNYSNRDVYLAIGSYLGKRTRIENLVVWGAGFWREDDSVRSSPKSIRAVRGPLSRSKLLSAGIECPAVYGDPALLYSLFYRPGSLKKYRLGVVPHYRDSRSSLLAKFLQSDVTVIDIENSIPTVVDQILQCERICSSSLHGMIIADTYGIPSIWIQFPDHGVNDEFKFRDYLASVERKVEPLKLNNDSSFAEVMDRFTHEKPGLDVAALFDSCPFVDRRVRKKADLDLVFQYPR